MTISFLLVKESGTSLRVLEKSEVNSDTQLLFELDELQFELLSQIDPVDQDIYNSQSMSKLIAELIELKRVLSHSAEIVNFAKEAIGLAKKCKENRDLLIVITPFGKHYKH